MAVLPQHDKEGNTSSHVIEGNEDYFVAFSPSKVIDFACRFFGSSLKGRQEGTKAVSNITHKAPISVAPSSGIYFLPTLSPVNPMCGWIDRKSTRLNSSHVAISYAVFCLQKK